MAIEGYDGGAQEKDGNQSMEAARTHNAGNAG